MTPPYSHVKSQLLAPFPAWPRAASAVTLHLPATQNSFLPQTCQSVLGLVPCTCYSLFLEFISSPFSQYFQITRETEVSPPWWSPSWLSRKVTHSPTPAPTHPLPSQALRPDYCLYHRLLKTSIYTFASRTLRIKIYLCVLTFKPGGQVLLLISLLMRQPKHRDAE